MFSRVLKGQRDGGRKVKRRHSIFISLYDQRLTLQFSPPLSQLTFLQTSRPMAITGLLSDLGAYSVKMLLRT